MPDKSQLKFQGFSFCLNFVSQGCDSGWRIGLVGWVDFPKIRYKIEKIIKYILFSLSANIQDKSWYSLILPFKISITLPDKSCPTLGIPPVSSFKLFDVGDFILEVVVMLKLFASGVFCNWPGGTTCVPVENIFDEKGGLPPISVPKTGVEITEGLTFGKFNVVVPNALGYLLALSWGGRVVADAEHPLLLKVGFLGVVMLL